MFGLETLGAGGAPAWLVGLAAFSFASSITPGPNNILLAGSGARFGARRTVRHALGIWAGMVSMLLLAAAGVGTIVATAPSLAVALHVLAAAALAVTAYGLARAPVGEAQGEIANAERPWSFWQAFAFQYLNPKAMMMAFTAAAMVPAGVDAFGAGTIMIGTFMVVSMPCTWVWVMGGVAMRRALNTPERRRRFNWTMAAVLLATIPLGFVPATAQS
jgi:threonine/homoserine/homoserine lactone efflux protein